MLLLLAYCLLCVYVSLLVAAFLRTSFASSLLFPVACFRHVQVFLSLFVLFEGFECVPIEGGFVFLVYQKVSWSHFPEMFLIVYSREF